MLTVFLKLGLRALISTERRQGEAGELLLRGREGLIRCVRPRPSARGETAGEAWRAQRINRLRGDCLPAMAAARRRGDTGDLLLPEATLMDPAQTGAASRVRRVCCVRCCRLEEDPERRNDRRDGSEHRRGEARGGRRIRSSWKRLGKIIWGSGSPSR